MPVILGNILSLPASEDAFHAANYQLAGELAQAGVKVAFSTGDSAYVRIVPYHAAMSVAWGMNRDEALKALTINAAEILGVADRVGSLEAGQGREPVHLEGRSARGQDGRHATCSSTARTSASTTSTSACIESTSRGRRAGGSAAVPADRAGRAAA